MKRSPLKRTTRLNPLSDKRREILAARGRLRLFAQARAKRKCERCGRPEALLGRRFDLHHLWPAGRAGRPVDEPWNVAYLCRLCHDAAHAGHATDWLASSEQEAREIRARADG